MRLAMLTLMLVSSSVTAQQAITTVAARGFHGAQANSYLCCGSISPDGRWIVFSTPADNLVRGDHNNSEDVFLIDRWAGTTERISVSSTGAEVQGSCNPGPISADGRWVLFSSDAENLAPGGSPGMYDCFLRDRLLGTTVTIPPSADGLPLDGETAAMGMTPDGRWIVFSSTASNILPGPAPAHPQIHVLDRQSGSIQRVSVSDTGVPNQGMLGGAAITPDGRYVAFETEDNLIQPADTNDSSDIYLRDLVLGTTVLVSRDALGLAFGASGPSITDDGRWVGFTAGSDGLVPDDSNNSGDLYMRDMTTGALQLASRRWDGGVPAFGGGGSISADGRYAVFTSESNDIVPGDAGHYDVFRRDIQTGVVELVSQSNTGAQGVGVNELSSMNAAGTIVMFRSNATNLVVPDLSGPNSELFLRDWTGTQPTIGSYCISGSNSLGCSGTLAGFGVPDANAGAGFSLVASGVQGQSVAIVHYGVSGPMVAPFGSSDSVRCVRPPLQRTRVLPTVGTAGLCNGKVTLDWNEFIAANPQALGAPFLGGEGVWAQVWVRDPSSMIGGVFTNAVWFTVAP